MAEKTFIILLDRLHVCALFQVNTLMISFACEHMHAIATYLFFINLLSLDGFIPSTEETSFPLVSRFYLLFFFLMHILFSPHNAYKDKFYMYMPECITIRTLRNECSRFWLTWVKEKGDRRTQSNFLMDMQVSLSGDMIEHRVNRRGNYVPTKKTSANTDDSLAKLVHFKWAYCLLYNVLMYS